MIYIVLLVICVVLLAVTGMMPSVLGDVLHYMQDITAVFGGGVADAARKAPPRVGKRLLETRPNLTNVECADNIYLYSEKPAPTMMNTIRNLLTMVDFPSRRINIHYYALPGNKLFSPDGKQTRDNINSAICLNGVFQTTIYIYREEEAARVLVHELLHVAKTGIVDIPAMDIPYRNGTIPHVKLDEAWVDAIASYVVGDETPEQKLQRAHDRVCTILTLANMNFDQYLTSRQPTNVREYYLIKYLILRHLYMEFQRGVNLRAAPFDSTKSLVRIAVRVIGENTVTCDASGKLDLSATR